MGDTVAGLLSKSKYSKNIYRTGDIGKNAPYTVMTTDNGETVVTLPLPTNLSSQMGADWQQEGVGAIKYQLRQNKELASDLWDAATALSYNDIFKVLDQQGAKMIRSGNEDVKALKARATRTNSRIGGNIFTKNPRNEMLFTGMPFKSYSFNFNLIPYKKSDSQDIHNAIRAIQRASAPAMAFEKMYMEYPHTWFVDFFAGGESENGNKYLMKLNECCCTSVNVNYTPQGDTVNLHEDNAPVAVELSLELTEIIIPTKETIDEGFFG